MKTTIILTILSVMLFGCMTLRDFKVNRNSWACKRVIRSLSCLACSVLSVLEIAFFGGRMHGVIVNVAMADALLLMTPCSYEKGSWSLRASFSLVAILVLMDVIFMLTGAVNDSGYETKVILSVIAVNAVTMVFFLISTFQRFRQIRSLFRSSSIWHRIEDLSRLLYLAVYQALCSLSFLLFGTRGEIGQVTEVLFMLALLGLYCLLYMKSLTGASFVLKRSTEDKLKEMIRGNLRAYALEKQEEDFGMNKLYSRIQKHMEEKKPFLDSSFSIADLAESLFSNKLYMSKTINIQSGRNFRQFVNYYRVMYAQELWTKDLKLKVLEVSEMSGFHTVVSFNMAFKLNTGLTPTEWKENMAHEKLL